ncbi:MAG: ATP-grasp domain-containing protein [Mesorhizobium sp.]|uniref:ATP-grasp domain-containing protein n=1 Tax=Mesorhizobium sp. TaxID=1871066 RepID=UPI000FE4C773|nr:MAG: ATP-grasp domain-containing protein [Mesorhizobium sp.]
MGRKALILVEGDRGNGPRHIQAAKRLGFHPITLATDPAQYKYLVAENVDAVRADTGNIDALISECYRLRLMYEIAGITGFVSDDVSLSAIVGKLSRHFGLAGPNPASVERCRDKFAQRKLLEEAGVSVPAYHRAANAKEVESFATHIGLPVVVKPVQGSGSMGVRLCSNVEELAAHSASLLGRKNIRPDSQGILVEEFVQGPHYGIDILGYEVIAIAALDFGVQPYFICRECTYPAVLNDDERASVDEISLSCLRTLGLGWGPTNIELRWTKRGPVVIGVSPHLPSSPAPELVWLAYGVDLIAEHIKLVTGVQKRLRRSPTDTAAARFLVPDRDGNLDWTDGDDRSAEGVAEVEWYIPPKTPIVRKGDYRDRIGHVIAVSTNRAQTQTMLQRAADSINWSITPSANLGE